jgi:hypothetical protein
MKTLKVKNPQYRVEYRFPQGTKHYIYFLTIDDAKKYNYRAIEKYNNRSVEWPLSEQLQKIGPRGGWSKFKQ